MRCNVVAFPDKMAHGARADKSCTSGDEAVHRVNVNFSPGCRAASMAVSI